MSVSRPHYSLFPDAVIGIGEHQYFIHYKLQLHARTMSLSSLAASRIIEMLYRNVVFPS